MERNAQLDCELKKLDFVLWKPCWNHRVKTLEVYLACRLSLQEGRMGFLLLRSYVLGCALIVCYSHFLDVSPLSLPVVSQEGLPLL